MITAVEDYFSKGCGRCDRFATNDCSARLWTPGLADLRRLCLDAELEETLRWGHPCYRHADRNIAIIGAFRGDFRLSFFDGALLKDPEGVLEKQGPNARHADMIRFTHAANAKAMAPIIRSYLIEAKALADAGLRAPRAADDIVLPEELQSALASDPELAAAFYNLTPGRQRSYVVNLKSAKTAATRIARIAKFRERIIAGKGATER